jgi:uncharacterized protein
MMQEVFDKLRNLQDILSSKYEIEKEIYEIPKALNTKNELLIRLKKDYIEKNDLLTETQNKIKHLKFLLGEAEREREDYEKQMDIITTQREYEALDKEIKAATEKGQQYRKDILREEKEQEVIKLSLVQEEKMISQQETELKDEQENIKAESLEKEKVLEELKEKESEIIPGLDEDILFKFERIIKSKSGLGIVPVKDYVCTGCHMVLPAQFQNDVHAGEEIHFCPYCSRILYYEEDLIQDDYSFSDADSGGLSDLVNIDNIDFDIK